ncbi:histidine kinase [Nitzschia inconspicua]|uniref:histidine kinase n=1 Tax=Nitzschia inconspicua TaxID=303405 RepID=A0A9K3PW20_9STRA|nr:histidine kinase [Nitzschia inconspicua]
MIPTTNRHPVSLDALSKQQFHYQSPDYSNAKRSSTTSSSSSSSSSKSPPLERPPIPVMPSNLFRQMAQSQLELLANSLSQTDRPCTSKVQSMILYLPAENVVTGQLEFTPAVLYPDPNTERVFIASDAASGQAPTLPKTLTKLPGFSHASALLPGYPMLSSWNNNNNNNSNNNNHQMPEVGVVEEVLCDIRFKTSALSVPLLHGSQTVGVLLVSPAAKSLDGWKEPQQQPQQQQQQQQQNDDNMAFQWTDQDKEQVSRAAQSLSMALMMDQERSALREQNNAFREGLSDSLHQVKNPIQALRTYGKILQTQIAETRNNDDPTTTSYANTPQLLQLVERLMVQSERVVDLLQPMDRLVESLDETMVFLPPAQNSSCTSQSTMVLWAERGGQPSNRNHRALDRSNNETHSPFVFSTEDTFTNHPYNTQLFGDLDMEMMFVTDVLDPVLETFHAIADEHGIQFQVIVEQEDEIPGVWGSPVCLQEAVTNVLDNAFKYTVLGKRQSQSSVNPNPNVRVTISPNINDEAAGVSIVVEDNGPGIDDDDLERIFHRGYRGEATSSMVEGKGIGLDISKALTERMGGKLEVISPRDNKFVDKQLDGTSMKFSLYRSNR